MQRRALLRRLALACATVLLAGTAGGAHGQIPPAADWHTIEAAHVRVTFTPGLEPLARHAAASAERAYAALRLLVADAPDGPVDIVLADNLDLSNGYATPFPSNRIVLYARPPVDVLELQYMRDWIELVVTHELAHVFHLDVRGPLGDIVRTIFGRAPILWPVFSAVGTPSWSVEGLAVGVESAVTGLGRVHGSYAEMVLRTAVLEDELDSIDVLTSTSPRWPGRARVYLYGALFYDYLNRRFGPDASARLVAATADAWVPPPLWFGRVASNALGLSFRDAWRDWQHELAQRNERIAAAVRSRGVTATRRLTDHGGLALYPRFSPDGRMIAYASDDRRSEPRLRVIVAATGELVDQHARNMPAPAAWLNAATLATSDVEFADPFHIYSDVHVISADGAARTQQVTDNARIEQVDAAPDGRIMVGVQNAGGTNRLVLVDAASGGHRPLTGYVDSVHWSLPRFSPRGDRIAAARWSRGGTYDLVLLDTTGAVLRTVVSGARIHTAPAWSPDARWLLFASDRTGIPNIFAVDLDAADAAPAVRQVTSVTTGAFYPDVAPDGSSIVFSAYHYDGFHIETAPFDPTSWFAPDTLLAAVLQRTEVAEPAAAPFTDSLQSAVAAADTLTGAVQAYRPLRHLRPYGWVPLISVGAVDGTTVGFQTFGQDIVARHSWALAPAVDVESGRTQGYATYRYDGLRTLTALQLHPSIAVSASRSLDQFTFPDSDIYIREREDAADVALSLSRAQWRAGSALTLAAERVRRVETLHNAPPDTRLRDPGDDFVGLRTSAHYVRYVEPPFAISRENGVSLFLQARRRWDLEPHTTEIESRQVVYDVGYSEIISDGRSWLALPLPGFARHVIAARVAALFRHGPGAPLTSVGGASAAGALIDVPGAASRLLPVRGFDDDARVGTRGWSASAEYRAPLATVDLSLRPLPIYLDRLGAALFADAGNAWCAADSAEVTAGLCPGSSGVSPLVGAGAEFTAFFSAWDLSLPLRLGFAWPLGGTADRQLKVYLLTGSAF